MSVEVDIRKNLFVVSGPSGCGKNTVYTALKQRMPNIQRVITATTRTPRGNEQHGVDYYFISESEYFKGCNNGVFVESAFYDDSYYATPISEIERFSLQVPVFLIVDTGGKDAIKKKYPRATTIFLMPPSREETVRRIKERGANTAEEIERRISRARAEIDGAKLYDHIVVNDNVDQSVDLIERIIRGTVSL